MKDHSVEIPHKVNPNKSAARFTDSGEKFKSKFEEYSVSNDSLLTYH